MIKYHAVMIDETGCEFGASFEAESLDAAWEKAREDYPESRVDELHSVTEWARLEGERQARFARADDPDDYFYGDDYDY